MFRNVVRLQRTWTSPPHQSSDRCLWALVRVAWRAEFPPLQDLLLRAHHFGLWGHGQNSTTTTGWSSREGGEEEVSPPGLRLCRSFQREARCKEDGTSARRVRWTCLYVVLKGDTGKLRRRGHRVNQGVGNVFVFVPIAEHAAVHSTAFTTLRTFLHGFWPSTGWSTATKGIGKDTHSCNSHSLVSRLLCVFFVAHHELCDDAPLQLPVDPFGNGDCRDLGNVDENVYGWGRNACFQPGRAF